MSDDGPEDSSGPLYAVPGDAAGAARDLRRAAATLRQAVAEGTFQRRPGNWPPSSNTPRRGSSRSLSYPGPTALPSLTTVELIYPNECR
jgi:hypothetical protein